jgi:hypothetical protein
MTSDAFTNNLRRLSGTANASTIEFNLHLEDHLALYMFAYDTARAARRAARYWGGSFLQAASSMAVIVLYLTASVLNDERWRLIARIGVLMFLALYLLYYLEPGRLFAGFTRSFYQRKMTRLLRDGQQGGLYSSKRRDRVVMTEHYFIETNDLQDTSTSAVEISEHKETRVEWSAVSSIDVTAEHAFFTVTDRGYLVLPRKAFADEASFLAFVDMALAYREAALLTPAPEVNLPPAPNTGITS